MDREGLKDADFAPRIERDRSMVSKLRRGIVRPTLALASKIEQATGGAVTIHSWVNANCTLCNEARGDGEVAACTAIDCPLRKRDAA